jgi:hypothetical protein
MNYGGDDVYQDLFPNYLCFINDGDFSGLQFDYANRGANRGTNRRAGFGFNQRGAVA